MRRSRQLPAWTVLAGVSARLALGAAPGPGLPAYSPHPVAFPRNASYLTRDGAIAVVGYNDMQELLAGIDSLFVAAHPDFRFALDLRGTKTAPPALARRSSAFAPMGAEFSAEQLRAYREEGGGDLIAVRVAHASLSPRAKSGPLLVVVHPSNPLERLTLADLARIFGTAEGTDGVTRWGQLGLPAGWAERPVHAAGLAADTALGICMLEQGMPGRRFRPDFAGLAQSEDVVRRVAADPDAIGFAKANVVTPAVKVVALAVRPGDGYSTGSASDLRAGRYPLDRFLYLYVRPGPGGVLDPWLAEYLRLVLSDDGQRAVAATPQGYLPLNGREVAAERARLGL